MEKRFFGHKTLEKGFPEAKKYFLDTKLAFLQFPGGSAVESG